MEGVMKQWEETETEVLEEGLRQRQARLQTNTSTVKEDGKEADFTGPENGGLAFSPPKMNSGEEELNVPAENLGTQMNGEIISQQEEIDKNKILPEANPISESSNSSNKVISESGNGSFVKKIEQEMRELYLERVYQKPETHAFYCPNCRACIQKVLIQQPRQIDTFRCTSCFSFVTPIGSWLFPCLGSTRDEPPIADLGADIEKDIKVTDSSIHLSGILQDKGVEDASSRKKYFWPDWKPISSASLATKPKETEIDSTENVNQQPELGPVIVDGVHNSNNVFGDAYRGPAEPAILESTIVVVATTGSEDVKQQPHEIANVDANTATTEPEVIQEPESSKTWEILKSIVYGGLLESIASLGVVTSAASADATTLNIVALALANLVGGLFILFHNLWELKSEQPRRSNYSETNVAKDRYYELLGKKENFFLHVTFAVFSFILFGLVPPLVYGFSFHESGDKEFKLAAVAGASLLCITLLAIAKAYLQRPTGFLTYLKTVLFYVSTGAMASIVSYLAGDLIKKLIEKLGWFESSSDSMLLLPKMNMGKHTWGPY